MTSPQTLLRLQLAGLAFHDGASLFENTTLALQRAQRIALIGPNGSGKSSMLRVLSGELALSHGQRHAARNLRVAYLAQFFAEGTPDPGDGRAPSSSPAASTGERFQQLLHSAVRDEPDLLLLDEPGDCLDAAQHANFRRTLRAFPGAICLATHDPDLLGARYDQIWAFASPLHPEGRGLHVFAGDYDAYRRECDLRRRQHATNGQLLRAEQSALRAAKTGDQRRASGRRRVNRNENDRNRRGALRETASASSGQQRRRRQRLLRDVPAPRGQTPVLSLRAAVCLGRTQQPGSSTAPLFAPLSFDLRAGELIAVRGSNGAGKSTLCAALAGRPPAHPTPDPHQPHPIALRGDWQGPPPECCQLIATHARPAEPLSRQNALEWLAAVLGNVQENGHLATAGRQRLLYDVGFQNDAQLRRAIGRLSGGELLRLELARLCARPPQLLILDEAHRHLDPESRESFGDCLREYLTAGGAVLLVAHSRLPETWPRPVQDLELKSDQKSTRQLRQAGPTQGAVEHQMGAGT